MKNRRWIINVFVEREEAGEDQIRLEAEATNLPDALIAAITQTRQQMMGADAAYSIHISHPQEADSDDTTQMPVAWITSE